MNLRWLQLGMVLVAAANLAAFPASATYGPSATPSTEEDPCDCSRLGHTMEGEDPCGCGCAEAPERSPDPAREPTLGVLASPARGKAQASAKRSPVVVTGASLEPPGLPSTSPEPPAAATQPARAAPLYLHQRVLRL